MKSPRRNEKLRDLCVSFVKLTLVILNNILLIALVWIDHERIYLKSKLYTTSNLPVKLMIDQLLLSSNQIIKFGGLMPFFMMWLLTNKTPEISICQKLPQFPLHIAPKNIFKISPVIYCFSGKMMRNRDLV